jgi:hypothetical protein
MTNNVRQFPSPGDKTGGPSNTGNGNPPGGDSMEARVAALEKVSQDIREKLVRVETKLESLEKAAATKTDIADLKTAIAEGFTSQTKWFISTAIALAVIAFTAAKFIHA